MCIWGDINIQYAVVHFSLLISQSVLLELSNRFRYVLSCVYAAFLCSLNDVLCVFIYVCVCSCVYLCELLCATARMWKSESSLGNWFSFHHIAARESTQVLDCKRLDLLNHLPALCCILVWSPGSPLCLLSSSGWFLSFLQLPCPLLWYQMYPITFPYPFQISLHLSHPKTLPSCIVAFDTLVLIESSLFTFIF